MDKYQKVKVLGKGSFGSAILIKRKSDGLLFVVKEVAMTKMSKKERDEARHECTVLQQLQHPNIVRYVEQFENRNNLYIVMEYCDGGDLAEKVKQSRGPMKESTMLYFFSQICLAMEYLHARHILHRDIKTMNVFLMKNGAVKLGDFGISTVLRTTMGMANTVCGTPYYFSPELCRNRPYNNKSDIWALGVLLYEGATGGRHPFDGTSMNQLMQRIVQGRYAPLSSQYSADFRKMVDWCLQKDPAKRPSIKQTLALPLMRRSLEQLEENLMLATQCRVRLKDIIDFESGMDQDERKSNSPQNSPRATPAAAVAAAAAGKGAASPGVSPGQAAALALAHQRPNPAQPPQPTTPSQSPVSSPSRALAAVGPKPGAGPGRAGPPASPTRANDIHRFYSPYQKRPVGGNPLLPNGGGAPPTSAEKQQRAVSPPVPAQQPTEEAPRLASPRSNLNLGNIGKDRRSLASNTPAAASPEPSPDAGDPFHADLRRVDAIIARYGRNTDEKAKETIHAYMRRKQEAYLKREKEELDNRERRNELRKDELRRVLENQRAAVSPTQLAHNNDRRSTPQHTNVNSPSRYAANPAGRSPRHAAPQPRTRSPAPSQDRESAGPRTPTAAAAFGRDPRQGATPAARESRPTSPQRQLTPPHPSPFAAAAAAAVAAPRRVVYAANSPQQALPLPAGRGDAAPDRRAITPDPLRSPSARAAAPRGGAVDIDWRAIGNSKAEPASCAAKSPTTNSLDDGLGGQRLVLQPTHGRTPSQPLRRHTDEGLLPLAPPLGSRPSGISLIPADARDRRSARSVASAAGPEQAPAGDARVLRPGRGSQHYLKPLAVGAGRGEEGGVSPVASPTSGQSPRRDVLARPSPTGGISPRARAKAANGAERPTSPAQAELIDVSRGVAASPTTPVTNSGPVEEALRILRRRKMQGGAAAPTSPSVTGAEAGDLPVISFASAEVDRAARRHQSRMHSGEAAMYGGMVREQPSRDDERFVANQHRRHHSEESSVPNTLEALRSLRAQQDRAQAVDGGAREESKVAGPLALLKQRHGMQPLQHRGSAGSLASAPQKVPGTEGVPSPRSDALPGNGQGHPVSPRAKAGRSAASQVTALSLGDLGAGATPPPTRRVAVAPGQASAPSSPRRQTAGGSGQSSMDGYTEMLQHLKDLLQRRRLSRAAVGLSAPASPTSTPAAQRAAQQPTSQGSPSPTSRQRQGRPSPPPPLNSAFSIGEVGFSGALLSPPHLKATKPLPASLPALHIRPSDDDDDFEDAVPLSPVRCAELNDTYTRQQQKKRQISEDVYTDDVDLTAAPVEEEMEGEEGYTGYYAPPSPRELPKGVKS